MASPKTNFAAVIPALAANLVVEERPIPKPGPHEVLIRNHAIGINPVDWKRQMIGFNCPAYPLVLGADLAGVVEEVGSAVSDLKQGDRVIGFAHSFISGNNDNGAYQLFTATMARVTLRLPADWTFEHGATLPTAVAVATMTLFDKLELPLPAVSRTRTKPSVGNNAGILIWGGSSTTGSMLIQFARLCGLKVFTTASEKHHEHLKSLGASFTVDYKSPSAVDDIVAMATEAGIHISIAADVISNVETLKAVSDVVRQKGRDGERKMIAYTVPQPGGVDLADGIESAHIPAQDIWTRRQDLASWLCGEDGVLSKWLGQGVIVPQKHRLVGQGLASLQQGLEDLRTKGVSGEKLVVLV